MKKILIVLLILTSLLTGCTSQQNNSSENNGQGANSDTNVPTVTATVTDTPAPTATEIPTATPEPTKAPATATPTTAPLEDNYAALSDLPEYFYFSSGAGAWSTDLTINADGTFSGLFHDSNMGETGENYPNGTIYICEFTGKFTAPVKLDDYSYSMQIESMETVGTVDEFFYENDTKYIYSEAYGLTNAEDFILYLPGYPVADLPEDFINWTELRSYEEAPEILSFYGFFNVNDGDAFVGYTE